jgi:hypothetical protein
MGRNGKKESLVAFPCVGNRGNGGFCCRRKVMKEEGGEGELGLSWR